MFARSLARTTIRSNGFNSRPLFVPHHRSFSGVSIFQRGYCKMTADQVPHPNDATGGDPCPHVREAFDNGPPDPKDSVAPEVDQLATDMCSLNMQELLQVNYLVCKRLGLDPDILSIVRGALHSGGGGAAQEEAPKAPVDSGFRRIVLREVPKTVKERFPIMKLMREENDKLSLADVCGYYLLFYFVHCNLFSFLLSFLV